MVLGKGTLIKLNYLISRGKTLSSGSIEDHCIF